MRTQSKTRENRAQDSRNCFKIETHRLRERREFFLNQSQGEEKQNRDKIGFLSTLA